MAQRVPGGPMPTLTRTVQRQEAGATPLEACGLRDGALVTVVGAKDDEINAIHEQESAWARRNAPRQLHPSLLRGAKPRSTATPAPRRVFGQCVVHPNTPSHDRFNGLVLRYLERLASDPAVLHVCRTHGYEVGTLTELLPHEHPNLLGLNENKGQRILLRIRTDAADGTRDYKTTRRVLMHELAHNEISEHPPEFKILNSKLNAEVDAYERAELHGTHRLHDGPAYERVEQVQQGGSYTLSGGTSRAPPPSEQLEERRARILRATETRLALLDQEINAKCGDAADAPPSVHEAQNQK
ncbi:uncharacterized protein MJAP1_002929 [Malassezia japonica]|uniref:WLM domain-containing protein n=1 Tax=Malassezia japonica TaxID=223818 RepID=A0AAF0F3I8_9BASI|nr:uncharacterized protein MJAP1_002929 [Malassezia japonica]WFD39947.1 hypothetical protein MJAP1_002929 [Malassezia japonica]